MNPEKQGESIQLPIHLARKAGIEEGITIELNGESKEVDIIGFGETSLGGEKDNINYDFYVTFTDGTFIGFEKATEANAWIEEQEVENE